MDAIQKLKNLAAGNGGIIETKLAEEQGVSRSVLSRLCKAGKIQRIMNGQYVLPDELQDELLSISRRSKQLAFSHETALYLNGISDRTPFEHSVTVPSGSKPSSVVKSECKIYYIKPELFDLGKTTLKTPAGNPVPSYDMERTICDIVRSRNKMGTETFLTALKLYAASPKKDLNRLNDYARQMRMANVIRKYLEVLL
jgi:predicted transcriptional regulator of viral defense system